MMQCRIIVLTALIFASASFCTTFENAKYIYSYFIAKGWTKNSICGMIGNMIVESGVIPDAENGINSYGLVQWTPKNKLITWAISNSLDYKTLKAQCDRIQWELKNGQQFYSSSYSPMTFKQYTKSTLSPYKLALIFNANYQRAGNQKEEIRGINAERICMSISSSGRKNIIYTVKKGDKLPIIAANHGVTVDAILKKNNISNPSFIFPGTTLVIPDKIL